jgi:hypothetical protein
LRRAAKGLGSGIQTGAENEPFKTYFTNAKCGLIQPSMTVAPADFQIFKSSNFQIHSTIFDFDDCKHFSPFACNDNSKGKAFIGCS